LDGRKSRSQERVSLITRPNSFNDFAFIVQFEYKQYIGSGLYLICFSYTTGNVCMCVFCKTTYRLPL